MKGTTTVGAIVGLAAILGAGAWAKPATTTAATHKTAARTAAVKTANAGKTAMKPAKSAAKTVARNAKPTIKPRHMTAKTVKLISPAKAASAARAKYHGKVVGKPVLQKEHGRHDYAVRLVSGNTTREVKVDAQTGKIEGARLMTTHERAGAKAGHKAQKTGMHHS